MNRLPPTWAIQPLGNIATLQRGFDLPVQARKAGLVPIYAANGPVGTHSVPKVKGPGVVTGRSGTLGKVHFVEGDYWPLNTALWVKEFHGNDPAWVYRLLSWMRLEQFTRGAGVPTLNRNLVHVVGIPLPPLAEQKRIAGILDAADALRAKRRESLAQLDALIQSTFLDMFGDPVTNPMGWDKPYLEDLCQKVIDCPHSTPHWSESGIVCLRTSNLGKGEWVWADTRYITEEDYRIRTKRSEIVPDDIILSREGTVGVLALVVEGMRLCMGQRLVQLRVIDTKLHPKYLLHLLLHDLAPERLSRLMAGSTSKHLNVRELRKLPVLLPPLSLQHRFATIIESIEQQKVLQRAHLAELDTLFASVQQRAFSGELSA